MDSRPDIELRDKGIRLIGIPFFGIAIPNITGLFGPLNWHMFYYWISYLYFILLAALIWQGNRYLLFRTRQRLTWFDRPIEKIVLLIVNNVFYTAPLTFGMLWLWYRLVGLPVEWEIVETVMLINVICVLFVTHVYETVFLLKERETEQLQNEQLQRARAEAELTALKNQIDPHFMFNSLNTLSYLIRSDPAKALVFTENLAEVYRYILSQKERTLVLLEDELEFTGRYIDLLKLRFGRSLIINNGFDKVSSRDYLIPPTSVFVAFENAVKHNELSESSPLSIELALETGCLVIVNRIRKKLRRQESSRIGLKNLDERFKILTGRGISAGLEDDSFVVRLPLITITT